MTEEEMLKKVQAVADETAQGFAFKRTAVLEFVYSEKMEDGSTEVYVLGNDMPRLIYRIFTIAADGTTTEITDVQTIVEKTRHYNQDVKPTLKLVPPFVEETGEYEVLLENPLPDHAVEIKLKSSTGRDITMIETYRYFDYVSRVFFVSLISVSFGAQFLFSVVGDNNKQHLRLIVGNDNGLRERIDKINELVKGRVLPSFLTIAAGTNLLSNPDAHAKVAMRQNDGNVINYISNFAYDDIETNTIFAFFIQENDKSKGLMFIQDIVSGRLTLANVWTEEQKKAADRVQALMKDNPEEFNKRVHNFFADALDIRYAAFKNGTLTAESAQKASEERVREAQTSK